MSKHEDLRPTTIDGIKRLARRIKASTPMKLADALDQAARQAGFENYAHAVGRIGTSSEVAPETNQPRRQPMSEREAYRARTRSDWIATIDAVPGATGSAALSWTDVGEMVETLSPFMGTGRNHGFFPTGGGHDFTAVSASVTEPGCIEFRVGRKLVYLGRPARLRLERIEAEPAESFLFVELEEIASSGVYAADDEFAENEAPARVRVDEELVDLGGGDYVERGAWDRGFVDDEDEPLPDDARLVHRLLRGGLMLACKASVWNGIPQTYNAIHDKLGADGVRREIERGLARRDERQDGRS
ncbi:hypothetical protein [uncultured Sphingomonas sp.]|uniref:hypothetical protein n=1 Tax=uncultured Sphingomonas sp. TaxID=158754 RepID=UPI0025FBE635|nr:hypothetical protein [uncultured Sphingomonas sp.]